MPSINEAEIESEKSNKSHASNLSVYVAQESLSIDKDPDEKEYSKLIHSTGRILPKDNNNDSDQEDISKISV
jgi:hypothetical protein